MGVYLLATDDSDPSHRALDYMKKILSPDEDEVIVLSVVEEVSGDIYNEEVNPVNIQIKLSEKAEETTSSAAEKLEEAGFTVSTEVLTGVPGEEICELAREQEVDGIYMGRRGRGAVGEFLLGSVSNYVLHHAPCPVTIVSEQPE
ncbi:MAG: universal stress protein [bacterium]